MVIRFVDNFFHTLPYALFFMFFLLFLLSPFLFRFWGNRVLSLFCPYYVLLLSCSQFQPVPFLLSLFPFFALLVPFPTKLVPFLHSPCTPFFVHPENCGLAILHKNCFLPRSAFSSSNLSVVFISTDKWNGCENYPDACIQVVLSAIPLSCAPQL